MWVQFNTYIQLKTVKIICWASKFSCSNFFSFLTFVFGNRIFSWFDSPDSKNQNQSWTNSKPTAISRKILYTEYILELVLFIMEQTFYPDSFFWRAITLWNRLLRICFQDCSNPNLFKSRINLYPIYIS